MRRAAGGVAASAGDGAAGDDAEAHELVAIMAASEQYTETRRAPLVMVMSVLRKDVQRPAPERNVSSFYHAEARRLRAARAQPAISSVDLIPVPRCVNHAL